MPPLINISSSFRVDVSGASNFLTPSAGTLKIEIVDHGQMPTFLAFIPSICARKHLAEALTKDAVGTANTLFGFPVTDVPDLYPGEEAVLMRRFSIFDDFQILQENRLATNCTPVDRIECLHRGKKGMLAEYYDETPEVPKFCRANDGPRTEPVDKFLSSSD